MKLTSITLYDANRNLLSNPGSVDLLDAVSSKIIRRQRLGYPEAVTFSLNPFADSVVEVDGSGLMFFRRRRILRFTYDDASFREYRITDFSRDVSGQRDAQIVAESLVETDLSTNYPRQNLTGTGADAVSAVISITGLTPQNALNTLFSTAYNPPSLVEAGTVDGSLVTTSVNLELDGTESFMDAIRKLAAQTKDADGNTAEIEFAWNAGSGKYRVHFYKQVGWTAAERTAGTPDATTRPVEMGPDTEGNRVELIRKSDDSEYFSRITPLGGPADETVTIGEAEFYVTGAVYSAPNTTLSFTNDDLVFTDGALVGYWIGNDSSGFFEINDSTAPGTIVVTGNAAALNASNVRLATDTNGRQLIYIDHPDALDGVSERRVRFSSISPFENRVADAGISPDLSSWSAGLPVGFSKIGSPTVTQHTETNRFDYGSASAKVQANTDEGLQTSSINLTPTTLRPYHSAWIYLSIESGSVRIQLVDSAGTIHPTSQPETYTGENLIAIKIEGMDPAAGNAVFKIFATEDSTVFYLDALVLTNSAAAYPYAEQMGPRGLYFAAVDELLASAALYADAYESEFFDVKELNIGSYNRIELGSHVAVRDAYSGGTHEIDFTARVVEIEIEEDVIAGSYKKRARFSRKPKDFSDRFTPGSSNTRGHTKGGATPLPVLVNTSLHINNEGELVVSWDGDFRTEGVYVTAVIDSPPSEPNDPTASAHDATDSEVYGTINLGAIPSTESAIVRIRPYQGSRLGDSIRLTIDGSDRPIKWQGAWSNAHGVYKVNDAVTHNDVSYICILQHDSTAIATEEPGVGAAWETYWDVLTSAQKLNWRSAWAGSTAYSSLDAVSNDGKSYICTVAHTSGASTEPGTGVSWESYWDLMADKGDPGSNGADGVSQRNRGAWADLTAYVNDSTYTDYVEHNGTYYACINSHTSSAALNEPGAGSSWTSYWTVAVAKGDPGSNGSDGADAVTAVVTPSNGTGWIRAKNSGSWSPAGTTTDLDINFIQDGADVCRDAKRVTLNTTTGNLTVSDTDHKDGNLNVASFVVTGDGTPSVTITASYGGAEKTINVVAIQGGDNGTNGTDGTDANRWAGEFIFQPNPDDIDGSVAYIQQGGTYRGQWSSGVAYLVGDIVRNSLSADVYRCTVAHTSSAGTQPGIGGSWASYWSNSEANTEPNIQILAGAYTLDYEVPELTLSGTGLNYIYFDPDVNADRLLITTSLSTAVSKGTGGNRVLIGVARAGATANDYAFFVPIGGTSPILTVDTLYAKDLQALFAQIDDLTVKNVLSMGSGGSLEAMSGSQGMKYTSDGITVYLDGNPVGTLAKIKFKNAAGSVTYAEVYFDDDTGELLLYSASYDVGIGNQASGKAYVKSLNSGTHAGHTRVGGPILHRANSVTPNTDSVAFMRYTDDQYLPKGYVGASGPVGIPVTWFTMYTSTTVSNTTSETTLLGTSKGTKTLPANHLVQGSTFLFRASGVMETGASNTLNVRFKIGSSTYATVTLSLGGYSPNRHWSIELQCVVASISGSNANIRCQGVFRHRMLPSTAATVIPIESSGTTAVVATGTNAVNLTAQWTSGDAYDLITCTNAVFIQEY